MKKAYHLFFSQELIKEPIMYKVAKEHDVLLNIRLAKVDHEVGEATVEFEGEEPNVLAAEEALKEHGVKVESILGDIVEG